MKCTGHDCEALLFSNVIHFGLEDLYRFDYAPGHMSDQVLHALFDVARPL